MDSMTPPGNIVLGGGFAFAVIPNRSQWCALVIKPLLPAIGFSLSDFPMRTNFTHIFVLLFVIVSMAPCGVAMQTAEVEATEKASEKASQKTTEKSPADDGPVISTADQKSPAPEVPDRFLRIQMWDGTVVSGLVSTPAIDVETEFGSLQIPIQRIVNFRPGTDSNSELNALVERHVEDLGDREFRTREAAHRSLVALGPMISKLIRQYDDRGDAERKKHLSDIRKEIDALAEEAEDEGEQSEELLLKGDQVVTPEFSIVGKIQQQKFQVKSKIGDLTIQLADIRKADRGDTPQSGSIRKTVNVAANAFFQKKPTSTKIRVTKGDIIRIEASGVVQWTNWNQVATPAGLPNQGNWNGHANGSLIARVSDSGEYHFIGTESKFTAKKSGLLYLGIAMTDNYANNAGYRWTGKFKAKIKIESGVK